MRLSAKIVPLLAFTTLLMQGGQALAQDDATFFIANQNYTLTHHGDWWYQGFTTGQRRWVLRFTADYRADAAIVPAREIDNFTSGNAYRGYAIFSSSYGTKSVVLPKGSYYVAMRNGIDDSNTVSMELDKNHGLKYPWRFYGNYIQGSDYVGSNGGKYWHQFKTQRNVRLFLDGCNSGLETYIIPAAELTNFKNDQTFLHYTDYAGSSGAMPGMYQIKLPPGTYFLCFRNDSSIDKAITYTSYRYVYAP